MRCISVLGAPNLSDGFDPTGVPPLAGHVTSRPSGFRSTIWHGEVRFRVGVRSTTAIHCNRCFGVFRATDLVGDDAAERAARRLEALRSPHAVHASIDSSTDRRAHEALSASAHTSAYAKARSGRTTTPEQPTPRGAFCVARPFHGGSCAHVVDASLSAATTQPPMRQRLSGSLRST